MIVTGHSGQWHFWHHIRRSVVSTIDKMQGWWQDNFYITMRNGLVFCWMSVIKNSAISWLSTYYAALAGCRDCNMLGRAVRYAHWSAAGRHQGIPFDLHTIIEIIFFPVQTYYTIDVFIDRFFQEVHYITYIILMLIYYNSKTNKRGQRVRALFLIFLRFVSELSYVFVGLYCIPPTITH